MGDTYDFVVVGGGSAGAVIDTAAFVIDLPDLGGADKLRTAGVKVQHLIAFEGD